MQNNSSLSSSKEEDKLEIIKNPPEIEKSVKYPTTKELMIKIENFLNAPIEQKESPSNKENQTLNIINDTLESNIQAITNVTSSNTKCLNPIFVNKSSNEKETKFTKNESNLGKQYHSKESIEPIIKCDSLCKKVIDRIEEKMDISTDSLISDLTDKQKCLGSPSLNDTTKRQILIHEADNKSTTNDTNESILSHEDVEIIDEAIVKDKTPIKQISKSIENTMEDITKSDEVVEVEYTIMDTDVSKNSNKIELNIVPNSSKIQSKIEQESDNKKNLKSISIIDDNEMKLVLEEQCQDQDQTKSPSVDLVTTSSVNKNSNDQSNAMEKQSIITQDNNDFTEQEQRNSSKYAIESDLESSNAALETINSTSNESNEGNAVIRDVLLSPILTEPSEKFPTNISSKKTETKSTLKNIVKQDLTQKNTDNIHDHLEKEKEDLQLKNQKDTNTNTDPDVSMFHAIPNDNFNEKEIEEEMDVEISSVHSNSQLLKENESETECDLVLVDKKAWLAAENIKAAKEAESFEYDSDDTVLLKSRLDARTTNYEQLPTINEDSSSENQVDVKMKVRNRDKKSLIMIEEEEMIKDDKEANISFRKRKKHMLEKCKNSSPSCTEDESDDLIANVDKSINEFKAILNQSNDRFVSKLNKSGQIVKATEQSFETDDDSDEIEDDSNRSNRSLRVNKKNKSLSKSMERRKSLNKSLTKDIPSRQEDKVVQNISLNKSQEDYSRKGLDNTVYLEKKVQDLEKKLQKKKRSLNKSQNTDEDTSKSEEKNLSNVETPNDDESDKDEVVISVMNFTKNYSIIASKGSNSDEKSDSSDEDNSDSPAVPLETHSNDADSNSDVNSLINSDIEREYNLNGGEQKFSDDNVPADECRASESEASDPDDNGSDLTSFIVDDDEVVEEEEDDDNIFHDDEEKEESNNEEENVKNMEEAEDTEKEEVNVESIDEQSAKEKNKVAKQKKIKNKSTEQDMDIEMEEVDVEGIDEQNVKEKNKVAKQKKIKNKNNEQDMENVEDKAEENVILDEEGDTEGNSIKYIPSNTKMLSPEVKSTKIKRDFKKKKFDMENKTILLDTSNSDSLMKNKSYTQKNEDIILLDTPNLSAKKKKRSNVQFSPEDVTEQNLMEQSNKSEKIRKLSKSRKFMECSTPKLDTCTQKFEFNETPETVKRISEMKDTKTDDTKTTQDTSFKKKKSKRDSILKENLSLREINRTSNEKKRLNRSLPFDLVEAIEKAGLSKPVHSKMSELRRTMNITHTESPTIRHLRKEKLNESAPALNMELDSGKKKLSPVKKVKDIAQTKVENAEESTSALNVELDSGKKKLSPIKKVKDIAQTKTKLENDEEESTSALNVELDSGKKKLSSLKRVKDIAQIKTKLENDEEESTSALNVELDSEKKKLSSAKKVKDIAQAKTKLENDEEEIPNLIIPSSDDAIQKRRKKQKKRKARTEDISSENIPDEALTQDVMESDVPKKKKRIKLAQQIVENDTCRDNQTDEKEKKRKKKQFSVIEQNENVNEENVFQKNIRENKAESTRRKRKNYEIVDSSDLNLSADMTVQKKSKRQKIAESEEMFVPEKLLKQKKKREEKISSLQIGTSELKSTKNLASNKLQKQNIPSDTIKSKNVVFTKARNEALEAIRAAEMRIRAKKELKKKKQENIENTTQKQVLKIPDKKQRKEVAEKIDILPSSSGRLKRLPDDVVENLTDQPTRAKKKQKLSRIQQQSVPSVLADKKSKVTTAMDGGLVTLSSSGSTAQFTVVDLQKAEKQSSKSSSAAASFRQRMLARNNREPVSAYMMYLEKQKATSSNRSFNNAF